MAAPVATPDLFDTLFDVLPTGVMLLGPCWAADGELTDFTMEALNPAGQHALNLPAQPGVTLLQQFPHNGPLGTFARYRQAYLTGERLHLDLPYQVDGLDSYYRIVVQRTGERLLMHFTDLTMLDARVARQALRATADAAQQERERLQAIFTQAPVAIALFEGPEHVVTLANADICAMWGTAPAQVLGKPLLASVPELRGQGFDELLAEVARTGVPFVGQEVAADLRQADGTVATRYFNFVYQRLADAVGRPLGVLDIAVDVTEQVRARQQVEQFNQELAARVAEGTTQLQAQQGLLEQILRQVPAAIATLSGPAHRFTFANAHYQHLVGERATVGLTVAEALPEVREQGVIELLDRVYQTGEPFIGREVVIMLEQPPARPTTTTTTTSRTRPCATATARCRACWCLPWT